MTNDSHKELRRQRAFRAFACALLVAPLSAWICFLPTGINPSVSEALGFLLIYFLYGIPIAFIVAIVIGLPSCFLLRRFNGFTLLSVAASGGLAGGATIAILLWDLKDWVTPFGIITTGVIPGICSGAVWWWLIYGSGQSRCDSPPTEE